MIRQKKEKTRKGRRITLHSVHTSLLVSFLAVTLSFSSMITSTPGITASRDLSADSLYKLFSRLIMEALVSDLTLDMSLTCFFV